MTLNPVQQKLHRIFYILIIVYEKELDNLGPYGIYCVGCACLQR